MNKADMMKAIEKESQVLYELGCLLRGFMPSKIEVRFDLKGGAAGQARSNGIVRFNLYMLENNFDEFLAEVVPHEIGHMIAFRLQEKSGRRIQPHGRIWRNIVKSMGGTPSRCHSFKVEPKAGRYAYICESCKQNFYVTTKTHERIQVAKKSTCSGCGGKVRFLGKVNEFSKTLDK